MKKIGLVGGLGPASTIEYYQELIKLYQQNHSKDAYPRIVIDSVDMEKHTEAFNAKDYDTIADYLIKSLDCLKSAGAEIAAITANTEHIVWDRIASRLPLPTVSIIDSVITEISKQHYQKVLVLGTEWTMRSELYEKALSNAGITPISPSKEDQYVIGNLIYPNLENGIVIPEDKQKMLSIIEKYIKGENAEALLLGCTELPLMIKPEDVEVPLIDSTKVHIQDIYCKAN